MRQVEASCPSCGGPVEFRASASLVTVCPSCSSVVARGDRKLEDHGKVAAIIQGTSSFYLGQTGRFRDHPFEIIGHIQYQHPAGGRWDEWYVSFAGGRWCWLAEAQGKRYLTQERKISSDLPLPRWQDLQLGMTINLKKDVPFQVTEFAMATVVGGEGELPFDLRPNKPHAFVDLTGADNDFATIQYDDEPVAMFTGKEVSLDDLGISESDRADAEPIQIAAKGLSCPQCSGALDLRAPEAERVICPYCSSVLDVNEGNLVYLRTLEQKKFKPWLQLGSEGVLKGTRYTVLGVLCRAVRFDRSYSWEEYLLYEPKVGFRWLVHSDRHWSFVEPVTVNRSDKPGSIAKAITHRGLKYQLFQRAWARVIYVLGEFYWKVSLGDTVLAEDFIAPPRMISFELTPVTKPDNAARAAEGSLLASYSERVASLGTYVPHEEIEKAFKVGPLPRGAAIAPNQPSPNYSKVFWTWPLACALLGAVDLVVSGVVNYPIAHEFTFGAIVLLSFYPVALLFHRHSFERSRWADSEFSPYPEYSSGDDDDED